MTFICCTSTHLLYIFCIRVASANIVFIVLFIELIINIDEIINCIRYIADVSRGFLGGQMETASVCGPES